jgi:flagellar biosynthetic protein FlhB
MAEGDEDLEKTEEPTSRKIEEAIKKGQVAFSREVTSFLLFVALAILVVWMVPLLGAKSLSFLQRFIASPHDIMINYENFDNFFYNLFLEGIKIYFAPLLACLFVVILASMIQTGIIFSAEPLMPKLEKISLLKGFGRIFSMRSIVEFLKGFIKIIILGYATYIIFQNNENLILASAELSLKGIMAIMAKLSFKVILAACILMFLVAILDYLYQKYEFLKSLRMTKQELKEEYKQSEGSPEIKAKLKQIRQERARKRMVAAVPKADVVIRNPTHYAIALKYEFASMKAPVVLALGQDLIALNIIKIAEENKVPVITNRNLAKALYETAELDEEIPLEHYKAVAEIIAYVYKLKNVKL